MEAEKVKTLAEALKSMLFSMKFSEEDVVLLLELLTASNISSTQVYDSTAQALVEKSAKSLALVTTAGALTSGTLTLNDDTTIPVTISGT